MRCEPRAVHCWTACRRYSRLAQGGFSRYVDVSCALAGPATAWMRQGGVVVAGDAGGGELGCLPGAGLAHRSSYSVLRAVCCDGRDAASIRALDRSSASGGTQLSQVVDAAHAVSTQETCLTIHRRLARSSGRVMRRLSSQVLTRWQRQTGRDHMAAEELRASRLWEHRLPPSQSQWLTSPCEPVVRTTAGRTMRWRWGARHRLQWSVCQTLCQDSSNTGPHTLAAHSHSLTWCNTPSIGRGVARRWIRGKTGCR
jgi:hypothetical protein